MHKAAAYGCCAAIVSVCFFNSLEQAIAQNSGDFVVIPAASGSEPFAQPPDTQSYSGGSANSTYEAAVECATAVMAEEKKQFTNVRDAAFKAGLCTGKVQTYMLNAGAEDPGCFPKISLEEGINIFVKWTEEHPDEGASDYTDGIRKAFEDAVPCLKK